MKNLDRTIRILAAVALVSFIAGAYFPLPADAISPAHISFGPPTDAEGTNSRLTTGWHGVETPNVSLDWDDVSTTTVYSRAWATSPDTASTIRAFGTPETTVWYYNCQNVVWLDVWDSDNPTRWLASVGFVHTALYSGFSRTDYRFVNTEYYNPGVPVAVMTSTDTCTFGGTHVHETHDGGGAATKIINSGGYPTGDIPGCPPSNCPTYQNNLGDNWTRDFAW